MRPPFPTRRRLLAGTGLAATLALLGAPPGFAQDTRILRARTARPEGSEQAVSAYDGTVPGPVLRVRRGEELRVRLVNELATETAIHWHGVRLPNAMDGTALTQQPVAPGASFEYRFTPPDAGTFWYHPPLRGAHNRPLHGLLIVDEPRPVDADRDVALVLDAAGAGFTANGLATLDVPVSAGERMRLRLLNASERLLTLRIDRHPVTVVAIDGQPAEPFAARESRVTLSPGNRADLMVDAVLAPAATAPIMLQDAADVTVARLVYGAAALAPARRSGVQPLPPNPLPERMDFRGALRPELPLDAAARDRDAPPAPLFSVRRGRTVVLALANRSAEPVVAHIHGHHVRLLDALDDGWKPFWLDTILCVPQRTTRVAFVADNPGRWLMQARAPGAEGSQLRWFEVV